MVQTLVFYKLCDNSMSLTLALDHIVLYTYCGVDSCIIMIMICSLYCLRVKPSFYSSPVQLKRMRNQFLAPVPALGESLQGTLSPSNTVLIWLDDGCLYTVCVYTQLQYSVHKFRRFLDLFPEFQ